jgi:hypothetical protein
MKTKKEMTQIAKIKTQETGEKWKVSKMNFIYKKYEVTLFFIFAGLLMFSSSCRPRSIIVNKSISFDTVTVGTHQYMYQNLGHSNVIFIHYEDCNNPMHKK